MTISFIKREPTMTILREVNVSEIPRPIFDLMSEYISWYTVGIRSINDKNEKNFHIGTVTLIDIEGRKGVLTAKHVSNFLKDANKVGLVISPNIHSYEIDTGYIEIIDISDNIETSRDV